MQRDIKGMTAPLEPGSQTTQLNMVLEQQHRVTCPGQPVGTGQAAQAGAYDDHVVILLYFLKGRKGHNENFLYFVATQSVVTRYFLQEHAGHCRAGCARRPYGQNNAAWRAQPALRTDATVTSTDAD